MSNSETTPAPVTEVRPIASKSSLPLKERLSVELPACPSPVMTPEMRALEAHTTRGSSVPPTVPNTQLSPKAPLVATMTSLTPIPAAGANPQIDLVKLQPTTGGQPVLANGTMMQTPVLKCTCGHPNFRCHCVTKALLEIDDQAINQLMASRDVSEMAKRLFIDALRLRNNMMRDLGDVNAIRIMLLGKSEIQSVKDDGFATEVERHHTHGLKRMQDMAVEEVKKRQKVVKKN